MTDEPQPFAARPRRAGKLYAGRGVLRTESEAEYEQLLANITRDVEPNNTIERIYVADVVFHTWENIRYCRIKSGILNNALPRGLRTLLLSIQLPPSPNAPTRRLDAAFNSAYEWQLGLDSEAVLALLQEAGLDESAIEAATFGLVAEELKIADGLISVAQASRDKALRGISKYRKSFADQLRSASDRALAADQVARGRAN